MVSNAGGNDLTRARKSPYIFRASFSAWQNSFPGGEWLAKNVGQSAAIMASDYAFGHESSDAFKETFTTSGGQVLSEQYPQLGAGPRGGGTGQGKLSRLRLLQPG